MLANQSASRCLHRRRVSVGLRLNTRKRPGMPTVMRTDSALDLPFARLSADIKHVQQLLQTARPKATQLQEL